MSEHDKSLTEMQKLLQQWVQGDFLRQIDWQLVRYLHQLAKEENPLVWLLTALVSAQYGRGHSCLLLDDLQNKKEIYERLGFDQRESAFKGASTPKEVLSGNSVDDYIAALEVSDWESHDGKAPLVLKDRRLYLSRLYWAEQKIVTFLHDQLSESLVVDSTQLASDLNLLFPFPETGKPDWQKLACAMAVQQSFSMITGGPGTGKTYTVLRLIAALQALANQSLTIRLAAPTGKAAMRLSQSINNDLAKVPADYQKFITTEVTTLHRLLGAKPYRRCYRYNRIHPLHADVVIVDEASMVDLELMAALIDALPDKGRLILIGDKDQLASVEAGAVFSDLCHKSTDNRYLPETTRLLALFTTVDLTPFQGVGGWTLANQVTVRLTESRRFSDQTGIGQLATAVNCGDAVGALNLIDNEDFDDISRLMPEKSSDKIVKDLVLDHLQAYFDEINNGPRDSNEWDDWAKSILEIYANFQLLATVRRGDWGVETLNKKVAEWLFDAGNIKQTEGWYLGRPVMVTKNEYGLGIMNGDIGITLKAPGSQQYKVAFMGEGSEESQIKWINTNRLSHIESVYVMTVHKSQGSEFKHCVLILPDESSPVLTRELIYTGLTRAREKFTLIAKDDAVLEKAINKTTRRVSGLTELGTVNLQHQSRVV